MSLPQPHGMTMREWADAAVLYFSQFDSVARLDDGRWQDWGVRLQAPMALSGLNMPDPYGFSDWFEWAQRIYEELQ